MHACFVTATWDFVTKLFLNSQTLPDFNKSESLMEKRNKGMYYSYKQTGLCCSAQYWSVWAFFFLTIIIASQQHGHPVKVQWDHVACIGFSINAFVINDGVCTASTVPITAFYLLCISKYFAILKWTWALQPYETPVNMSLMLWECFYYYFLFFCKWPH